MIIKNRFYTLTLCDKTGKIDSMINDKNREFIHKTDNALIKVTLLSETGERIILYSNSGKYSVIKADNVYVLTYENVGNMNLTLIATLKVDDSPMTYWNLEVQNKTGLHLEKTNFPCVIVPNDLVGNKGDSKLFWSAFEGVEIDDLKVRETTGYRYHDEAFPSFGWDGRYPGSCQTQFLAYYNSDGGLYFAAHDADCNVKSVEVAPYNESGIKLILDTFTGENDTRKYKYNFYYVLGMFEGNYYDAAEIYKQWLLTTNLLTIPKIKDNKKLPEWIFKSPVVVMCGLRGKGDSTDMDKEVYYPYTSITPIVNELNKELDSPIMQLLCHWEGTAPWAPPYTWPPYKSLENFQQFIKELHDNGNYFALYCSGLAWANKSGLIPSYNREKEFEEKQLWRYMQLPPNQKLSFSGVCGMPIREGYDMCPACDFTKEVTLEEIEKIITNLDIDYLQYFDQNLGGNTYMCYSKEHGHPSSPGKWQNKAMLELIEKIEHLFKEKKKENVLLGCEANAAEPFINKLLFNDSRHNIGYNMGTPVPTYNYIFHEHLMNFMGNQNTAGGVVDYDKYPDNLYYRYAQSFSQGDYLTIVLKDNGTIMWDWNSPWEKKDLEQAPFKAFIKELNSWRQNFGKETLLYGKMLKPLKVNCEKYHEDINWHGGHDFDSIVSNRYEYKNGSVQFLVNYLSFAQTFTIDCDKDIIVVKDACGKIQNCVKSINGKVQIEIEKRKVMAIII